MLVSSSSGSSQGGVGYGAGGGAGGCCFNGDQARAAGGDGAAGMVYVEWDRRQ